jgi:hypothetical protein
MLLTSRTKVRPSSDGRRSTPAYLYPPGAADRTLNSCSAALKASGSTCAPLGNALVFHPARRLIADYLVTNHKGSNVFLAGGCIPQIVHIAVQFQRAEDPVSASKFEPYLCPPEPNNGLTTTSPSSWKAQGLLEILSHQRAWGQDACVGQRSIV